MSGISRLTIESVQIDLDRASGSEPTSTVERSAGNILLNLQQLYSRLHNPVALEVLYLHEDLEHSSLPINAYQLVQRVVENPQDAIRARKELRELMDAFHSTFREMNIIPVSSSTFYLDDIPK